MIRYGRFGLTAQPSPARAGLCSGADILLADSLIGPGAGSLTPWICSAT